ncbi:MAG TPA: hypothetical protein VGL82_16970 [Bryobacteraceae bacterium]|jgi:hypothetical protein
MAKSKKKWPVILGAAFIVIVIALVAYTSAGNTKEHCEVCVTFNGRTNCGSSAATTREQAERAATDLACNGLTSGMTELMQCQNSPTRRITFKSQ